MKALLLTLGLVILLGYMMIDSIRKIIDNSLSYRRGMAKITKELYTGICDDLNIPKEERREFLRLQYLIAEKKATDEQIAQYTDMCHRYRKAGKEDT